MELKYKEQNLDLKYDIGRIKVIEKVTNMPLMALLSQTSGMMSLETLETYFAYGLKNVDNDSYIPVSKGLEIADDLIQNEGYSQIVSIVVDALQRDCPFFFQVA